MESGRGRLGPKISRWDIKAGVARPLLAAVFPHFCVVCGVEGRLLCDDCREVEDARVSGVFCCPMCRARTPFGTTCSGCRGKTALDGAIAVASYGRLAWRELLHAWKYEGADEAGETAAAAFARFWAERSALAKVLFGSAAIVPVPLHWYREARRGFNQAEPLAFALAAAAGARVEKRLLTRRFGWTPQAQLPSGAVRALNVASAFRLRPGTAVPPRIVLVDDVLTTGATLNVCARILKAAGAKSVWAVTLLRG
ncbi:MAG: phosphoribosyltransferase family protein [Patescibacteria group bacterium]|nr:phosphoribosyltransferase family protein [Patescibacteria group bacterium]